MRDIYLFLHICSLQRYKEIFQETWEKSIPMFNDCKKMYINVVGPGRMEDVVPKNDKIELTHYSDNPQEWEFPTQHLVQKICKEKKCYVLYYHLRGVTSPLDNLNVVDNRRYLTYFNVEKYKIGLNLLEDGFDVVSVDLATWPVFHFSGNMWWARSEHINSLVDMEDLPGIPNFYAKDDIKHRHRCEMWITSNPKSKYIELWNCGIHPSQKGSVRYYPENYLNKF
jgi:hypothetical protein